MLKVARIEEARGASLERVGELLLAQPAQTIGCVNWPAEFPEKPEVSFRMAHDGDELFIRFDARERGTMARVAEDNGEVWTDSCVEFFISLDDTGYYNFEFTCIGKALAGFRKEKPHARHGSPEVMASIRRWSSLGDACFAERPVPEGWTLVVAIPAKALFAHNLDSWASVQATANLYKCGDKLSAPHFLSWQPIDTPSPNFHVPPFFTPITFE